MKRASEWAAESAPRQKYHPNSFAALGVPSKPGYSSSAPAACSAPIPLIDLGDGRADAEMALSAEAREVLHAYGSTSSRPLVVICVVGCSRTGKSFLLNRGLMNKVGEGAGGFQVSASIRACTKGLWMAGPPVPAEVFWRNLGMEVGGAEEPYDVLVVDTEGINALDRDQSYDLRIFTLALLLSSVFVYNSLGAIDEGAISTLSAVADVAAALKRENARPRSGVDDADLPSLLWVVRDFSLTIERGGVTSSSSRPEGEGGGEGEGEQEQEQEHNRHLAPALAPSAPLSDQTYLEEALSTRGLNPLSSKAQLRNVLTGAFPRRACHTMVRPAEREEDMRRLQTLPDEALRAEFVAQLRVFRSKLRALCRPKRVGPRPLDASLFADLAEQYVAALNSGQRVPVISDAWTQVTRARCEKGVSRAAEYVERVAREATPSLLLHPGPLHAHIAHGLRRAEAIYAENIAGVPDTAEFDRQLQQRLLVAVSTIVKRGEAERSAAVRRAGEAAAQAVAAARAGAAGAGNSSSSSSYASLLASILSAVRSALPPLVPSPSLPEPVSRHIPSVVEELARGAALADAAPSWEGRVVELLSGPEGAALFSRHGAELPPTGVDPEAHAAVVSERDVLASELEGERGARLELQRTVAEAEARAERAAGEAEAARREAAGAAAEAAARRVMCEGAESAEEVERAAAMMAEAEARVAERHRAAVAAYEQELDERAAEAARTEAALREAAEREAELRGEVEARTREGEEAARRAEAAGQRAAALEAEVGRMRDKVAARAGEVQKLTEAHAAQRMEWAARLRSSETESARATGSAEALSARVRALEGLSAETDALRAKLHDTQLSLARAEAEGRAAQRELERVRGVAERREAELDEHLRTLRDMQRQLRSGGPGSLSLSGGPAAPPAASPARRTPLPPFTVPR